MEWNHSTRDFTSEQSSLMLRKVETFSYDCYICKSTSYYVNIAKTDHCIRVEFLKRNLKEVENSILLKSERKIKKIVMLKSHFVLSRYLNRLPRYKNSKRLKSNTGIMNGPATYIFSWKKMRATTRFQESRLSLVWSLG